MSKQLLQLFSTPIYMEHLDPIPKEIKEYFYNKEYKTIIDYDKDSKIGLISTDRYVLNDKKIIFLKKIIENRIKIFTKDLLGIKNEVSFYITNSWLIKHETGHWGPQHSHQNSIFSGVLYLETNKNSGDIIFHNDGNFLKFDYNYYTPYNSNIWRIQPENNMLLIFPSTMQHSVSINRSDTDRYCLAFNFSLRGALGKDTISELILK